MFDADSLVFVDVDTQRDFLEPAGALYVPGSDQIHANLARLTALARARQIPVIATADAHTPNEPDPEPFPPHCLVGTPGQQRHESTAWPQTGFVLHLGDRFDPASQPTSSLPEHLTIEKRRYDVFSHPEASRVVAHYRRVASKAPGGNDPVFVVYGVATEYCVRAVVEGLLARGARVAVVVDAVRAIDPSAESSLLTDWARRGVSLVRTLRLWGVPEGAEPACPPGDSDRRMPV